MSDARADVLMITYNSADYVKLSLPRLLDSCGERDRVWLWHNGTDQATLEVTQQYAQDKRVYRFHHSVDNVGLREPTNWLWANADGAYVSKVDDDCLLPLDWIERLHHAHQANQNFGAIGASRLRPEDVVDHLISQKTESFNDDVQLFRNHWVQGSGYLLRRPWVEKMGFLGDGQSWPEYCLSMAKAGAINGFLFPLLFEDHMDDPRSSHTLMKSDTDLAWRQPLSANRSRVLTLEDWQRRLERSAREVQAAPLDLRIWSGWRKQLRSVRARVEMLRSP